MKLKVLLPIFALIVMSSAALAFFDGDGTIIPITMLINHGSSGNGSSGTNYWNISGSNLIPQHDSYGIKIHGNVTSDANINLPVATSWTKGMIRKYNSFTGQYEPFISDFGNQQVLIGTNVGNPGMTGDFNVAIGAGLLTSATSTSGNLLIGSQAGYALTTGSDNIMIGLATGGYSLATGSHNIVIGKYAGNQMLEDESWKLYLGDDGFGVPFIYGDYGTYKMGIFNSWPTATLDISGNLAIQDTNDGGSNAGHPLCIGGDNIVCQCGACN